MRPLLGMAHRLGAFSRATGAAVRRAAVGLARLVGAEGLFLGAGVGMLSYAGGYFHPALPYIIAGMASTALGVFLLLTPFRGDRGGR